MSSNVTFTTIPLELRLTIYEYVASDSIIHLNCNRRSNIAPKDTVGILFTNRQIHDEALPVFRRNSAHLLTLPVCRNEGEPFLNGLPESLCGILPQIGNLDLKIELRPLKFGSVLDFDAHGLVAPPCHDDDDEGHERQYYLEDSTHNTKVQMSLQVDDLVSCIQAGASLRAMNLSIEVDKMLKFISRSPWGSNLGQCLHQIGDLHGLIKDVHVEGDDSLAAKFRQFEATGDKRTLGEDTRLIDFTLQGYEWEEEPTEDWKPAGLENENETHWWPRVDDSSESYEYEYGDFEDEESSESYPEVLEWQNKEREAMGDWRLHIGLWSVRDKLAHFGYFAPDSVFNNSTGLYEGEVTRCQKCFAEERQE